MSAALAKICLLTLITASASGAWTIADNDPFGERVGILAAPGTVDSAVPSHVLADLASWWGFAYTAQQADAIAQLDGLPSAAALGGWLAAFAELEKATTAWPGRDATDVLAAHNNLLAAAVVLKDAWIPAAGPEIAVPFYIAMDLEGNDTTYTDNYAIVFDVGGDDHYHNNAGGSNQYRSCVPILERPDRHRAGALMDLSGDDSYGDPDLIRDCGINGGGIRYGAGFLFDVEGNDTYLAGDSGTNGGGYLAGVGMLIDLEGDDTYTAGSNATNGGGYYGGKGLRLQASGAIRRDNILTGGYGFLYDRSGDDTYSAGYFGTNGGGMLAAGMGSCIPICAGVRVLARGHLIDADGDDVYRAKGSATNGAAIYGQGLLRDLGGDDQYYATTGAVNGDGRLGSGLLVDSGGSDYYESSEWSCVDCSRVPASDAGAPNRRLATGLGKKAAKVAPAAYAGTATRLGVHSSFR